MLAALALLVAAGAAVPAFAADVPPEAVVAALRFGTSQEQNRIVLDLAAKVVREDAAREIRVEAVRAGSVAERRGLRRGDQLLRDGPGGRRRSVSEVLEALCEDVPVRVLRDAGGVPVETLLAPAGASDRSDG